jgi:hypothetical protein
MSAILKVILVSANRQFAFLHINLKRELTILIISSRFDSVTPKVKVIESTTINYNATQDWNLLPHSIKSITIYKCLKAYRLLVRDSSVV